MKIEEVEENTDQEEKVESNEFMTISMHALIGVITYHTIRSNEFHEKKLFQVLNDNDNTHNFIDKNWLNN